MVSGHTRRLNNASPRCCLCVSAAGGRRRGGGDFPVSATRLCWRAQTTLEGMSERDEPTQTHSDLTGVPRLLGGGAARSPSTFLRCWNLALRSLLTDYSFLLFIKRNTDIHFQRPRPTHFHLTDYSSFYGLHPTQLFTSLHLMCCCVTISMSSGRTPSSCSVLTSLFHEPGTSVLDAL